MITKIELGERISAARKRLGLSQAEVGQKFGKISHAAISDIERGKTTLGIEDITKMSEILQVSFEDLTLDYKSLSVSMTNLRSSRENNENMVVKKSLDNFEKYLLDLNSEK